MTRKLFISLLLSLVVVMLPSCNSSSSGYVAEDDTLFDIVTVVATGSNGTSFSVQKDDSSAPVTLTCTNAIDTAQVGKRVLIAYRLPSGTSQYTNSTVELVAAQKVINDTVQVADVTSLANEAQNLLSANVVGNYLDIKAQCSYKDAPARYALVLDESTVNDAYPTIYLTFKADNYINSSSKDLYASFNISKLRSNKAYAGFKLVWIPSISAASGTRTFKFSDVPETIVPTE
jgi:hypothetical protein